jgi:Fe-S oxidoreductase
METVAPLKDGVDLIKDRGGETSTLCFQCGLCSSACPWNSIKPFITHKLMRQAQFGLYELENDEWWWCTTCRKCVERCPRGVEIAQVQRSVRELATEWNANPASIRSVTTSLSTLGNPWQGEKDERTKWTSGLDVKQYSQGMDLLYYPCCTVAYDKRLTGVARATADILQKTGFSFGILGAENCCGESIKKAGNEKVFRDLSRNNIFLFLENSVNKVLVNSPHCYITFKDEYPALGGNFETVHLVQLLANLLNKGKLKFKGGMEKKIIYHDPCYLGRYGGIYDEPRELLKAIPGVELIEFRDNRKNSLCCGGGGGRIFMETKKGERFSDIRLKEAIDRGAAVLATACPYCLLNFKDGQLSIEKGETLEVKDISELIQEVI